MAKARQTEGGRAGHDVDLVARAAWLHFVGGLTQAEVARRLGVSTTRAHRFIARAQSEGLVRVFVDVRPPACLALETRLAEAYGLGFCRVGPEVPETGPLPLRALGPLGGDFLMQAVSAGGHGVIGIGNGRTLTAAVDAMGTCDGSRVRFVSMLGGLTRSGAANPHDVIHRLARRTGAEGYLMPVPLFVKSAEHRRVMMDQPGLAQTMELIGRASLVVLGIGDLNVEDGAAASAEQDRPGAVAALRAAGARAEILGQFLREDGAPMRTPHDDRVMAPPLASLAGREVVAIAGGAAKVEAIRAALRSRLLTGLITDEATARRLVDDLDRGQPKATAA